MRERVRHTGCHDWFRGGHPCPERDASCPFPGREFRRGDAGAIPEDCQCFGGNSRRATHCGRGAERTGIPNSRSHRRDCRRTVVAAIRLEHVANSAQVTREITRGRREVLEQPEQNTIPAGAGWDRRRIGSGAVSSGGGEVRRPWDWRSSRRAQGTAAARPGRLAGDRGLWTRSRQSGRVWRRGRKGRTRAESPATTS